MITNKSPLVALILIICFSSCEQVDNESIDCCLSPTFSVLGDSISSMQGYVPEGYPSCYPNDFYLAPESTWWLRFAILSGWSCIANSSYSGSTIVTRPGREDSCFISDNRISALSTSTSEKPNYIIVLGGTNDWKLGIPFGDSNHLDNHTFCGAYRILLNKLADAYPKSNVICCSILPRVNGIKTLNKANWSIEQANFEIEKMCIEVGAIYIDLTKCGLDNCFSCNTFDGLHPNAFGMALISDCLLKEINYLIATNII